MTITFDGTDVYQGAEWLAVPLITVWKRFNPRDEVVAMVPHGSTGELLEHRGNRCKVKVEGGVVGYLSFWFIKELKQDWLEERKAEQGAG